MQSKVIEKCQFSPKTMENRKVIASFYGVAIFVTPSARIDVCQWWFKSAVWPITSAG